MREIHIGDQTRRIDCNAFTVYAYSELKGGADLKNVLAEFERNGELAALPMNTLLEVLWAMEKTCNPTIAPYPAWLADLPVEVLDLTDMGSWVIEVVDLLTTTFFRQSLKQNLVAEVRQEAEEAS